MKLSCMNLVSFMYKTHSSFMYNQLTEELSQSQQIKADGR